MKPFSLKAFAKINPVLHVGALRADGYHEIDTIMQLISLHDTITFEPNDELRLDCSMPELSGESNIAWKALRLMSELVDVPPVRISIEKRIPIEAGLGGGSSDCASVLIGVRQLIGDVVPKAELQEIGAACGSDVSFFLAQVPRAHVGGRGEWIEAIDSEPARHLVLAKPNVGVSTKGAYAALDAIERQNVENDFVLVAPQECRELMQRMESHGCSPVNLCGSGSAVYGEVACEDVACSLVESLRRDGFWSEYAFTLENAIG